MPSTGLWNLAHVKWFTRALPGQPEPLADVLTTPFLLAALLTVLVLLLAARFNVPLQEIPWVKRIHGGLERFRPWSAWLIRVGMAIPLIGAGLGDYLFHYELGMAPVWLTAAQVPLGLMLLIPRWDRGAAVGVMLLYALGALHFGMHPLLDYVSWLGAAYFLLARGTTGERAAIPVLYITTGLSLSWAAVEKWVYPHMALDIISGHGIPTFGFPPGLFLMLAGWVELGVGYLLITGVLNRFLSLVVTGLFVMTSAVFGPREILGHWQLHTALLVFLAEGTGPLVTPVLWHRSRWLQMAFVGVTLVPFVAVLIGLYYVL